MTSNKIVVYLLCIFLLAGAVFLGILTMKNLNNRNYAVNAPAQNNFPVASTSSTTENIATTTAVSAAEKVATTTAVQTILDSEIKWLAEPVKLKDLKLVEYSSTAGSTADGSTDLPAKEYYKVADVNGGGEIINVFTPPEGPGFNFIIRFRKTAQGKYFLIKQNSDNDSILISKVAIDSETNIKLLNAPEKISLDNIMFTKKSWFDKMPLAWNELEKIKTTDYGDFYKKLTTEDYHLSSIEYVLKLPDSTAVYYDMPYDFLASDNTLIATFNDANQEFKAKKFSTTIIKGCSGLDDFISESNLANRLYSIGTTTSGRVLYAPKNTNDELFKAVYDQYKLGRDGAKDLLSYEAFVAKKSVVVWRDLLGNYHVFYDSDYGGLAECGKPVIYLYPKNKTEVKVQVGANIRISEPAYNNGWRVIAYPDGRIINNDGAAYESLYWEGLGRGYYPAITQGRVVMQINIEAELRHDLAALGLNQKEAADFVEFWLSKMPKTAYIRLTWLNTADMERLAPLVISPRPDTVARVFLDFAGQDTPAADLAPPQLKGFLRTGFTVVEWGGLLIGNK